MDTAHKLEPSERVDVLGPTVSFLTPDEGADEAPALMLGSIPPGVVVPLHTHADTETFLALSGTLSAFAGDRWVPVGPGDIWHVPGNVPHAFRNEGDAPAVMYVVSTNKIARFFREIAAAPEAIMAISERYGYWNASPEENAAIGLDLSFAP
jgi:quercetin dioxygenase-like cupin family protein